MGRTSKRLGKLLPGSPEDIRFRGSFGVSAKVAKTTWELMEEHGLRPPGSDFLYFLWALAFMRTYPPNDNTLSHVLGGHDPKTISKNIWPVIRSIYSLNDVVVSWLLCNVFTNFLLSADDTSLRFMLRFNLKTGRNTTLEMTVCFPLMALIFALQWAGERVFIPTNLRRVVFDMRLVCASKQETFAGGVVRMRPGYGMMVQFLRMGWWHIWSLGSVLRRTGVTVAAHLSMWNAPMVCWQTRIQ